MEELSEEMREVAKPSVQQLGRVGNERHRVRPPSHAHDALSCLQNSPDSLQYLSFPLPSPIPTWGRPLPSLSSHCIPKNGSEALQNGVLLELLRFPSQYWRIGVSLWSHINISVSDLFKLEGDKCLEVTSAIVLVQFHSFFSHGRVDDNFLQRKPIISRIRKTLLAKSKPFLSQERTSLPSDSLSSACFALCHICTALWNKSDFILFWTSQKHSRQQFCKMCQDAGCSVGPAVFYVKMLHFSHFGQPIGGAFIPRNKTFSQPCQILIFAFIKTCLGWKIICFALKSFSDPQLEDNREKLNTQLGQQR